MGQFQRVNRVFMFLNSQWMGTMQFGYVSPKSCFKTKQNILASQRSTCLHLPSAGLVLKDCIVTTQLSFFETVGQAGPELTMKLLVLNRPVLLSILPAFAAIPGHKRQFIYFTYIFEYK